jgi:hypothetical protein
MELDDELPPYAFCKAIKTQYKIEWVIHFMW